MWRRRPTIETASETTETDELGTVLALLSREDLVRYFCGRIETLDVRVADLEARVYGEPIEQVSDHFAADLERTDDVIGQLRADELAEEIADYLDWND